jgi:hypothetical protein
MYRRWLSRPPGEGWGLVPSSDLSRERINRRNAIKTIQTLPSSLGSRALLLRLGLLSSFSKSIHRRYDSLDGGSARRKDATYTQDNTNTE